MNFHDLSSLVSAAWKVRESAYAPYSKFQVGAALESESGEIFVGCNVENLSFGLTQCAERVAIGSAVAAGVRNFRRILIVSDSNTPISPCGACRQVLAEFSPELEVHSFNRTGEHFTASLKDLLPRASEGILG